MDVYTNDPLLLFPGTIVNDLIFQHLSGKILSVEFKRELKHFTATIFHFQSITHKNVTISKPVITHSL